MSGRAGIEGIGAALALFIAAGFIASFALGLGGRGGMTSSDAPAAAVQDPRPQAGRLEVLNASGRAGIARSVTQRLRDAGFDVVFFGNAAAAHGDSTIVIARARTDVVARAAARALGVERVTSQPDSLLYLDATVVIGKDWLVEEPEQGSTEPGLRQRIGRWLGPGR